LLCQSSSLLNSEHCLPSSENIAQRIRSWTSPAIRTPPRRDRSSVAAVNIFGHVAVTLCGGGLRLNGVAVPSPDSAARRAHLHRLKSAILIRRRPAAYKLSAGTASSPHSAAKRLTRAHRKYPRSPNSLSSSFLLRREELLRSQRSSGQ
jgi:hypothetical protein